MTTPKLIQLGFLKTRVS